MITTVGENSTLYSVHSLRAGGATELFLSGASMALVQVYGRWKSESALTHMNSTYGTLYSLCTFPVSHVEVSSSTSVHHSYSYSSHTYYYLLSAHCCGLSLTH